MIAFKYKMKFFPKKYKKVKMSSKRLLKDYEIEDIISFIKPQKNIPRDAAMAVVNYNKEKLRIQLRESKIYPEMIPSLKEMIEKQYVQSKIQPGESVGIISAQSIGAKQTQMTLDSFHTCGSAEKTITTGVPRIEELLNATKDPKTTNCFIYFEEGNNSIEELRETIGHSIVELTFKKITKSYTIEMDKKEEKWYRSFKVLYGNAFEEYSDCISLQLDMDILYKYKLNMETIANIVSRDYSDMCVVFSPDNIGQLDIFVDTSDIDLPEDRLVFIDKENAKTIYLEEVVQPILEKIIICGIPGIENMYFNKDSDKWMVETDGSNFQKLLGHPSVDSNRTISNDMWDIYHTLGVEAVRQFLIEEFINLMTGINPCHVQILSEKMTHSGSISSISRYSMRTEDSGPMCRASFEETLDNFLKAGAYGQEEITQGVSASIICGKLSQIGTGMCDIRLDVKALEGCVPVVTEVKEEIKERPKSVRRPGRRYVRRKPAEMEALTESMGYLEM